MGATLVTRDVARAAGRRAHFYSTYGWHPLAVEAALATLDRWEEEGEELLANVRARRRQIEARLRAMGFETGTDFRGLGLALAVEMRSEDDAAEVVARCRRRGLLVSNDEETLSLLPPLVVDEETVDRAMDVLEDGLGRAGRSRRRSAARRPRSRTVRGSTSRRRPTLSGARGPRRPGGVRRTAAR